MVVRNAQPALNTHTHLPPICYWQPLYWILAAFYEKAAKSFTGYTGPARVGYPVCSTWCWRAALQPGSFTVSWDVGMLCRLPDT